MKKFSGIIAILAIISTICATFTACFGEEHNHTYGRAWEYDSSYHWLSATCEHTDLTKHKGAHADTDCDGLCDTCEYVVSTAGDNNTDTTPDDDNIASGDGDTDDEQNNTPHIPEPSDIIIKDAEQSLALTSQFTISDFTGEDENYYYIVQGGCTDGTYYYVALTNNMKNTDIEISAILKYDLKTGELVAKYEGKEISHCNDMTINTDTGELIAVHNTPKTELRNISIFDLNTLEFKEKKTLDLEIYAMSYDPYEKCYWVGISYGYNFAKLDLDFKQIGETYIGEVTGYVKQGIDVDSEYIYFLQHNSSTVMVYDKAGNYVTRLAITGSSHEPENIFHIEDNFYIGYFGGSRGGALYKAKFVTLYKKDVSVEMSNKFNISTYVDSNNNKCSVPQGSCTDGKHIYIAMNNNVKSNYVTAISKVDISTGNIIATTDGFNTGITNDLTYNSKTNQIIAVHNTPSPNIISIIDADTMTVVERKTLAFDIYGLAYDETSDCYFAGISNGYNFVRLDADFNQFGDAFIGQSLNYTKQGMDCDGEYIYFALSAQNSVAIYNTNGNFVNVVLLPESQNSAQSICHIDGRFYIGYYDTSGGGIFYDCVFTIEK